MKNLYQFRTNEGWYSSIYKNYEQCDEVAKQFAISSGKMTRVIQYKFVQWRNAWVVEEEIKTYLF